ACSGHDPDAVVLCVDDDPAVLDITKSLLKKNGYSVLTAASGNEALNLFQKYRIDVVVVDYEMPHTKGHEVSAALKMLNPKVPVVLLSGASDIPATVLQATDAFVTKGRSLRVLVGTIAKLIQNPQ
ncbi:MAG TPA: response regulator, partial [Candidatus Angelobacter sp.]|nr:response regulator [Candidatus Angelobacter sp.]